MVSNGSDRTRAKNLTRAKFPFKRNYFGEIHIGRLYSNWIKISKKNRARAARVENFFLLNKYVCE